MINPPLDQLIDKVDSKYTLVVAAAKRGREIMNGKPKLVETKSNKPVSIALQELASGKLYLERVK
ncbi:MAG: DNA-directed RNA polymerase subunit omega [Actinobacteria bacterium]|nr:DNA-directed RNA polymerase subunit omega [Actinomycetota bacterium]